MVSPSSSQTSFFAKRVGLVLAGCGVYAGTSGLVYLYLTAGAKQQQQQQQHHRDVTKQQKLSASSTATDNNNTSSYVTNIKRNLKYDELAPRYDSLIGNDERIMGISLFRRSLIHWHARGTVLEMAAGTGRNCPYYYNNNNNNNNNGSPGTIDRVVLTETSEPMMRQAEQRIRELQQYYDSKGRRSKPQFATLEADSTDLRGHFPNGDVFDTVIDTFGLCSYNDPVKALREMNRLCKADGRILLLEHGRSRTWDWITNYLDSHVELHAQNWGCIYNRDIEQIVSDSGLHIEILHTWHFGTTYYVVCKPNKNKKEEKVENDNTTGQIANDKK